MKTRMATATAALLALGFATMTFARQGPDEPKARPPADSKAALRPRVARLRAEIELLMLEHDGDMAVMKDIINGLRMNEVQESVEAAAGPMFEEFKKAVGGDPGHALPKLDLPNGLGFDQACDARKLALVDKGLVKVFRKLAEPLRADFLEKATALNEKKLELADLEQWMSVAP